jgi:hypothetical protein
MSALTSRTSGCESENDVTGQAPEHVVRPLGERFAEVVRWRADEAATVAWTTGTTTGGFGSLPPDTDAGIDVPD